MNSLLHSLLRCAIVTSMLLLNACIGAEPAVSIEKKLFLIDPGSLNASVALKVTIAECPLSGFLAFDMHGLDSDNFVLASFPMHVMELVEGKRCTCTKRQEIPGGDFARITSWQIASQKFIVPCGQWRIDSLTVKPLSDTDSPSIGSLMIRMKCHTTNDSEIPKRVLIQAVGDDGFELGHFEIDEYDCTQGIAKGRGKWIPNGRSLELEAFEGVFRPLDFTNISRARIWNVLPFRE